MAGVDDREVADHVLVDQPAARQAGAQVQAVLEEARHVVARLEVALLQVQAELCAASPM